MAISRGELKDRQSMPLDFKVRLAEIRVREFYERTGGRMYVSFSGGKDSTVLLDIVRGIYPDTPALFVDTGLEFPEIKQFVKTVDNVIKVRPEMSFKEVLRVHGFPIVSKEQAQFIREARTTKSIKLLNTRINGNASGRGKVSKKWLYLLGAPFCISEKCCDVMKKRPAKLFEKKTGLSPIVGTMAGESQLRQQGYLKDGCNMFNSNRAISRPLSIFLDTDIWDYIGTRGLSYSKIYDMGEDRTGCVFCMFGCHRDNPNRFQRMAVTHPDLHRYCLDVLGLREVLEFMGVPYE